MYSRSFYIIDRETLLSNLWPSRLTCTVLTRLPVYRPACCYSNIDLVAIDPCNGTQPAFTRTRTCSKLYTSLVFFRLTFVNSLAFCWATVCKAVRPVLSDRCLSCQSVCDIGVLCPNGWMDQDATWYRGRPRPRPHCVRWGPSSPAPERGTATPTFGPNGSPSHSQQLLSSCSPWSCRQFVASVCIYLSI